ncbi:ABC transporter ATP-binding protein [candidate division KSB1 bacterium]|nr:ABC transporter ATP-binding protein [candidate division KSB1 bacterium]
MNLKPIAQLKNINFAYQTNTVLENINLTIMDRDFLGIIGPNGGGKTTLLKIMLGLLIPDSGEVHLFDQPVETGRKSVGYVPQLVNFDFNFPMSVLDVVLMGRLTNSRPGHRFSAQDQAIALEKLGQVGLAEKKDVRIGNLSGGQRQRAFIARALAMEPRMLLLDEPVVGLDPTWQIAFYELLHELNNHMTIVLVTHDVSVVSEHIDLIACVNRRIHYHGSTRDGIHHISKMYHCPVDLVAHSIPHRSLKGHKHD